MAKRSRLELPSVDSLLEQAQQSEKSFSNFKNGFQAISSSRLMDFGRSKLQNLGEKEKTTWLFATYSASTVTSLCAALGSTERGFTELQRSKILSQYSGLTLTEASTLGDFILNECRWLVGLFAPQHNRKKMLAPPGLLQWWNLFKTIKSHKSGLPVLIRSSLRCEQPRGDNNWLTNRGEPVLARPGGDGMSTLVGVLPVHSPTSCVPI